MNDSDLIMPTNIEAEQAVIGSLIIDDSLITEVSDYLTPNDFYNSSHQKIYSAIMHLHDSGSPVDLVTLITLLRKHGVLDKVGGAHKVSEFVDNIPFAANVFHYARLVKDAKTRRTILLTAQRLSSDVRKSIPTEELIRRWQGKAMTIEFDDGRDSFRYIAEFNDSTEHIEEIEKANREKKAITGVGTGFDKFDHRLGGIYPGDLIVVAARPGMGKTSYALQVAEHIAQNYGPPVFYSLEMTRKQLRTRTICRHSGIASETLRTGMYPASLWPKINDAFAYANDLKIIVDDRGDNPYQRIRQQTRKRHRVEPVSGVIIDHLQLVTGARHKERVRELGIYTSEFKAMAKELNIPVILLCQLNRKVEDRNPPRPRLSDLRESGTIEENADVVLFLYRSEYYQIAGRFPGHVELIVAKNRSGPVVMLDLFWDGPTTSFSSYIPPTGKGSDADSDDHDQGDQP